jgi:hypothetical protein
VCGTFIIPDEKENDLEEFVSFLYNPNLGKAREFKFCKLSAFILLGRVW